MNGKIIYEEVQQFRVKWLWALILLCVLSSTGIIFGVALLEKGNGVENWLALALVLPLESVILYLFYTTKFELTVTSEGIHYRWRPFQQKGRFLAKTDIAQAEIRTGPSMSFGFHHWVPGYGKVHNVGPGKGVHFTLQNGKRIFLGTQTPTSLQTALKKIMTVSYKE